MGGNANSRLGAASEITVGPPSAGDEAAGMMHGLAAMLMEADEYGSALEQAKEGRRLRQAEHGAGALPVPVDCCCLAGLLRLHWLCLVLLPRLLLQQLALGQEGAPHHHVIQRRAIVGLLVFLLVNENVSYDVPSQ